MTEFKPEGNLLDTPENKSYIKSISGLKAALEKEKILEGRVVLCDNDHNLIIDLGDGLQGIIPRTEGALGIEEGTTKDIAIISRVNKAVAFVVTEIGKNSAGEPIVMLSRRKAQQLCYQNYLNKLVPGNIVDAKVTHLEAFGCFVDIGCGIPSLIPIDYISVSRISHPKDRFKAGDNIKAIIKTIEENGRISLSHKELLGTWEENAELFSPGQTVSGIVRSVESYGVFVELTPNLAGLAEPKEGVFPGQQASVYIKSLLPDKMKVKLIIVDSFEAQYQPEKPRYFITSGQLQSWRYSPEESQKIIETEF